MKIKFNLFSKSFLLSFLTFGLIAAIIITSLYLDANAIDPKNEETNMLVGITDENGILSICVLNFNPSSNSISFLPVPDNVWLENGIVLQNSYKTYDITNFKYSLEALIGTKINRYLLLSVDSVAEINDKMGAFDYQVQYPFAHDNEIQTGFLHIYGDMTKSMFSYNYDFSKVSVSKIAFTYLNTFLATYAKPSHIQKLSDLLSSQSFISKTHTNLSKNEIKTYCEIFSQYSSFNNKTIELNGTYNQASSSIYFIPENTKSDKNIFK